MRSAERAGGSPADVLVERLRAAGCVFAEDEAEVLRTSAASSEELEDMVCRRVAGAPLELVVGWAELLGHRVMTAPGVFVPRRRSELLAREAVRAARAAGSAPVVVDLGCGTGVLGLVVAREVQGVEVHAVDIDPDAVACARTNLAPVGGSVHQGDLLAALPDRLRGTVAVVVANAPYVPRGEIDLLPPEARDHEHRVALDGGGDGVDVQRRVVAAAGDWMSERGVLLVETSERQLALTCDAFARQGFTPRVSRDRDLSATVVMGSRS